MLLVKVNVEGSPGYQKEDPKSGFTSCQFSITGEAMVEDSLTEGLFLRHVEEDHCNLF